MRSALRKEPAARPARPADIEYTFEAVLLEGRTIPQAALRDVLAGAGTILLAVICTILVMLF